MTNANTAAQQARIAELERVQALLVEVLTIAHDHLDMDALRISHCKDAGKISAALAQVQKGAQP